MGDFGNGIPGDPPNFPTPNPLGGALEDIFNYIGGVFSVLLALIRWVWSWFRYLVTALILLFQRLKKFLLHVWQSYVKAAIGWLTKHAQSLQSWLKRTLGPVIKWAQKVKKWYDEHILKQQLRMLQQIQTIRRFLGILRLFHVKWATQLDGALADVQNRIEQSIALVRGHINGIINWLNALSNPVWIAGLLHKGGFFVRSLDALLRAAKLGGLSSLTPGATRGAGGPTPDNGIDAMRTAMHQDTATQSGPFNESTACANAAWKYQDRFGN
jgi:hypothetical protein